MSRRSEGRKAGGGDTESMDGFEGRVMRAIEIYGELEQEGWMRSFPSALSSSGAKTREIESTYLLHSWPSPQFHTVYEIHICMSRIDQRLSLRRPSGRDRETRFQGWRVCDAEHESGRSLGACMWSAGFSFNACRLFLEWKAPVTETLRYHAVHDSEVACQLAYRQDCAQQLT